MGSVSRRLRSRLNSGAVERAKRSVQINAAMKRFRERGQEPPFVPEPVKAAIEAAGAEVVTPEQA